VKRAVLVVAITLAGCRSRESRPVDGPESVAFEIQETGVSGVRHTWLATHRSGCRFRIEMDVKPGDGMSFTDGALAREDTDCTAMLAAAARALQARAVPTPAVRYRTMPFAAALLGRNLSRGQGPDQMAGAFTSKPRGGWMATKVFLGDEQAEFFLNLNPELGWGEISLKDPDYARDAMNGLAQVLSGTVTDEQPRPAPTPTPTPTPAPTPNPQVAAAIAVFDNPAEHQPERRKAMETIGRQGRDDPAAIAAMSRALQDADGMVRFDAMLMVERFDPRLAHLRPEVTAALGSDHHFVRILAAERLVAAGEPHGVLDAISPLLKLKDDGFDARAAQLAGRMGAGAAVLVPAIIELTAPHRHPHTRYLAIEALGAIGPPAAQALPLLRSYINDPQTGVAGVAREAIPRIQAGQPPS
jgi:hypothetical protein